jgi:MraZ protein
MFLDTSVHSLDSKGRVFVPKRFLQVLSRDEEGNPVVYLSLGQDGCLFLFSEEGFRKALERINTAAIAGPAQRTLQRLFFSVTQRTALDGNGRLLIPERLRAKVGLDKEVVMVGVASRAEIWPRERWEAFFSENEDRLQELETLVCDSKPDGEAAGGPRP